MNKPAQRKPWQKAPNAPKRLAGRKLQERRARWFRAHPLCAACDELGITRLGTQLDHIVPLSKGGSDTDEANYQSLCAEHHEEKSLREKGYKPRVRIGIDGWPVVE
ncbi:MAG: HNH endonuclease signature motif containing protein [Casimicrobiaceae bacterium]